MKNGICYIIVFLLVASFVCADEGINIFEYNTPINIIDSVENTNGEPCTTCVCNITVYNINSNTVNFSANMTNNGNGIYNATIPTLDINQNETIYPVTIVCNEGLFYGVSTIKGIRIESTMNFTPFAMIVLAITSLFAFIAFKIETNNPQKAWMKWTFFGLTIFMLIVDSFLGSIMSQNSGVPGLAGFFNAMMWFTGVVFIIFLYFFLDQIFFGKKQFMAAND